MFLGSLEGVLVVVCVEIEEGDFFRGPEGRPEKISMKSFRSQMSRFSREEVIYALTFYCFN